MLSEIGLALRVPRRADPEAAVVELEARAVLSAYDDFVRHYEIAYDGA